MAAPADWPADTMLLVEPTTFEAAAAPPAAVAAPLAAAAAPLEAAAAPSADQPQAAGAPEAKALPRAAPVAAPPT
eukprot:9183152-Lingulodinium_polyedra.AAC.1